MAKFKMTPEAYAALMERSRQDRGPRAVAVRYDRGRGRVMVRLDTGLELAFAARDAQGLERATSSDLSQVRIDGAGSSLHFPTLDADFSIAGLLEGRLGSDAWMARRARWVA